MTVESSVELLPIPSPPASKFGVEIRGLDLANLSDEDFKIIERALYEHHVVLFKNQQSLSPYHQYALNHRFSPTSTVYGHDNNTKKTASILHPDLKPLPNQPQVQLIGNGLVPFYEGLTNAQLRHPHHRTFHKIAVPDSEDLDVTRFYRWHIDAALYGADMQPPKVTTLMAVKVPTGRRQTLRYDDGTGDALDVSLGTTAFVSGEKSYEILSEEQKFFARTTRVEYAPHPYIWMSKAKSLPTGLGLFSDGLELPVADLPPVDEADVQIHPMCWKNPVTGKLALQIHPSAVRKLHLQDGTVIDDIAEVREQVYSLLRPGIAPEYVYAHDWEEGDMVLFHNRGVLHTVCGAFAADEVRMFRQCNLADRETPVGPDA
ncbi:Alpha-ketoglutarate-dependent xanthine dioxygenase xan-1 [Drechslerella dactyloides]|uniref:Alpha-ketoglutarate-dependent xanthine dioxygenase xan-1 n=1 Tax=Drechslerella dactyloides TaxID=74499 RepID=A0AAD6J3S3_DREDA|nr:Alpha-ketoglutarate-dependent xanthine dioxygenase xan-1 [Drechslerella dactyloides]